MGKFPEPNNASKDKCEKTTAKDIAPKIKSLFPKINIIPIGTNSAKGIEWPMRDTLSMLKKPTKWSASKIIANNPPTKIYLKLKVAKAAIIPHIMWPMTCSVVADSRGSLGNTAVGRNRPIIEKHAANKPYTRVVLNKYNPNLICNSFWANH